MTKRIVRAWEREGRSEIAGFPTRNFLIISAICFLVILLAQIKEKHPGVGGVGGVDDQGRRTAGGGSGANGGTDSGGQYGQFYIK